MASQKEIESIGVDNQTKSDGFLKLVWDSKAVARVFKDKGQQINADIDFQHFDNNAVTMLKVENLERKFKRKGRIVYFLYVMVTVNFLLHVFRVTCG